MGRKLSVWPGTCRFVCLLLIAICLVLSRPARGQGNRDDSHVQEVRAFFQHMRALRSLKAHVVMQVDNQQRGVKASYEGDLEMRGNAFHFAGMGMEIYSDGRSRWQYLPEEREVTVYPVDTASSAPLDRPLRLLREYQKDFKVRFRGERSANGKTYYDMTLYPRDIRVAYSQIHVAVDKKTLAPEKLTYQGKDGVHYIVRIGRFKPNAKVRTSFAFTPPKGADVEVIDLR